MALTRVRLKHDPEVIGSGIPMVSASQKAFAVDDVVYTLGSVVVPKVDDGWDEEIDDDEQGTVKDGYGITAHRVIQINYQERYIRIRCGNGCEQTVSYGGDSCSRVRVYHRLTQVKNLALRELKIRRAKLLDLIESKKVELEGLDKAAEELAAFEVSAPASIREGAAGG